MTFSVPSPSSRPLLDFAGKGSSGIHAFLWCFFSLNLADVSDFVFFVSGAGKGRKSPRRKGGGVLLLGNIERGKGVSEEGRWGGALLRWEGVAGRGVGLNIFFGAEMSTK